MPGCERARAHRNRASTPWNHVERRTCVCIASHREKERERRVSLLRWHTFATNRLLSRTSRPFLSLSHPVRTLRRGSRVDFFFQPCLSLYLRTSCPRVLLSYDKYIYIHDFDDTSIAVGRSQLFSPSHCHRSLLYPSDETLLTNSPVGEHKEDGRERERGKGRRDFVTDSITAALHRTDEFNCDGY